VLQRKKNFNILSHSSHPKKWQSVDQLCHTSHHKLTTKTPHSTTANKFCADSKAIRLRIVRRSADVRHARDANELLEIAGNEQDSTPQIPKRQIDIACLMLSCSKIAKSKWPQVNAEKCTNKRPLRKYQLLVNAASVVRAQKDCPSNAPTVQSRMCHHPVRQIASNK
jgi:hypothetical protein